MASFWMCERRGGLLVGVTLLAVLAVPALGRAQSADDAPAFLAVVEGPATLARDGQLDQAGINMPIVPGDRLRTTTGRVEIRLPDGSALDVDNDSDLELQAPALFRLFSGRVTMTVPGAANPNGAVRYRFDTPAASAQTETPGAFRIALTGAAGSETELAVLRGLATLSSDRGSMSVAAGQFSVAHDDEPPSFAEAFNSARQDDFDRWSADRQGDRITEQSSEYLPQDLRMYGSTFDQYGSWQYDEPYGYVWYPAVAAGWRPYYFGHWSSVRPYGLTWVGLDAWSWPTYHYGRWQIGTAGWYWIPSNRWAPAWVSWAAAPGYVGWCPLGFDGHPAVALSTVTANPWTGWVVVSRGSFGSAGAGYVPRHAISPAHLPHADAFLIGTAPAFPRARGVNGAAVQTAVPRSTAPAPRATAPIPTSAAPIPASPASIPTSAAPIPRSAAPIPHSAVPIPGVTPSPVQTPPEANPAQAPVYQRVYPPVAPPATAPVYPPSARVGVPPHERPQRAPQTSPGAQAAGTITQQATPRQTAPPPPSPPPAPSATASSPPPSSAPPAAPAAVPRNGSASPPARGNPPAPAPAANAPHGRGDAPKPKQKG